MEKIQRLLVVILAIVVCSSIPISNAAKKPVGVARKEDIPYIKCQVCEMLAKELSQQVAKKQAQISPRKISEFQIIEISENVCNLKKQEADWILKIDIVEKGDKLELVEQDSEGQCGTECKTIERACQDIMGYSDIDVAEYVYKTKPQPDQLAKFLCKDLTKVCSKPPPPVPKDRTPGEPFVAKSAKEAEMEKILKSMEGMPGAPNMKMYSRDDLMNMNLRDEDADEDDDDGEETNFPSKIGKVLREKERKTVDWNQKITKGVKDAGQALKKHAQKTSNWIGQWWRKTKAAYSLKKSQSSKHEL
ncbi:hypothetical protein RJ641_005016 [Dillenia turbinata]|uniref:Saposin B-type domain-containing protein n=1 Tax=Dillenia turbinata TaxID=194707 RepID=A0AAN8VF97_9MAGN